MLKDKIKKVWHYSKAELRNLGIFIDENKNKKKYEK
jgi:hypothetical protein